MSDTINRQAAVDVIRKCNIKEVTPAYMLIDKTEAMMELMKLPSAELKTKLIAEVKMSKEDIQSAVDNTVEKIKIEMKVPEIIRCKDCKYYYNNDPENIPTANIICFQMHEEDFCSYAERRTDE